MADPVARPSPADSDAVRAGPAGHPGRGQLAGAGLPVRRRHALLRGPGRGRLRLGRRGPPLRRLRAVLRGVDPRPRPPEGGRGDPAGRRRRHDVRGADRAGGPAGRGDLRPGRRLRAGPAGQQRDRGGHVRGPPGPGCDRPGPRRAVRRLLPRPQRRPAGRRRERRGHPRTAGVGRRRPGGGGRHAGRPLQRGPATSPPTWPA